MQIEKTTSLTYVKSNFISGRLSRDALIVRGAKAKTSLTDFSVALKSLSTFEQHCKESKKMWKVVWVIVSVFACCANIAHGEKIKYISVGTTTIISADDCDWRELTDEDKINDDPDLADYPAISDFRTRSLKFKLPSSKEKAEIEVIVQLSGTASLYDRRYVKYPHWEGQASLQILCDGDISAIGKTTQDFWIHDEPQNLPSTILYRNADNRALADFSLSVTKICLPGSLVNIVFDAYVLETEMLSDLTVRILAKSDF